MTTENDDGKS